VVGKLERPSPTLACKVSDINFNPYLEDPGLHRRARHGAEVHGGPELPAGQTNIRIFDGVDGPEDRPGADRLDHHAAGPLLLPPGAGRRTIRWAPWKINFPDQFTRSSMHDTPAPASRFGGNVRFESSGLRAHRPGADGGEVGSRPLRRRLLDEADLPVARRLRREQYEQPVENGPDVRWMYLHRLGHRRWPRELPPTSTASTALDLLHLRPAAAQDLLTGAGPELHHRRAWPAMFADWTQACPA